MKCGYCNKEHGDAEPHVCIEGRNFVVAELSRLRAVNAELVKALKWIASRYDDQKPVCECASDSYEMHCVAA